jgi:Na+:H+ antiporter, NhaA family
MVAPQSNAPHVPHAPPEAWEPLLRLTRLAKRPLERFLAVEAASGILLLVSAAVALLWANSRWADAYQRLWDTPIGLTVGAFQFERPLAWVVNDGLMVVFFFVVGMEIRRELHHGELSTWRRAVLPAAAALGGMVAPAGAYLALAGAPATHSGWGVPMATDIAFALGILTLLGRRAPPALRVLLLALAVIDDLGAIVVIALFYSAGVAPTGLVVALGGVLVVLLFQRVGVRAKLAYVPPALVTWAGIYASGIHPTIAGVIIGMLTPVRAWLGTDGFVADTQRQLNALHRADPAGLSAHDLASRLHHIDLARREAMAPAESLIESLHPWVAFGIMPLFALANAGVHVSADALDPAALRVLLGTASGLVLGKPVGVLLAVGLVLKLGVGTLPRGLGVRQLVVLGVVAGIGFTMALFVAQLAFVDPQLLAAAKLGVLAASALAALGALACGYVLLPRAQAEGAAESADEAEGSTLV